jgi:hypothetical protein
MLLRNLTALTVLVLIVSCAPKTVAPEPAAVCTPEEIYKILSAFGVDATQVHAVPVKNCTYGYGGSMVGALAVSLDGERGTVVHYENGGGSGGWKIITQYITTTSENTNLRRLFTESLCAQFSEQQQFYYNQSNELYTQVYANATINCRNNLFESMNGTLWTAGYTTHSYVVRDGPNSHAGFEVTPAFT